jgi:hypothetical protein
MIRPPYFAAVSLGPAPNMLLMLGLAFGLAGASRADVFHLKSGGEVEGKLVSETGEAYTVLSVVGEFTLPKSMIQDIEKAPSAVELYEPRRAATPQTAPGQYALACWCAEHGMRCASEAHLRQAIAIHPDYAPARRALGYVRVGSLWVDGRRVIERRDPAMLPRAEARETERLTRAIQGRWRLQIRAHRTNLMSGDPGKADRARAHLAAITDPLAIEPLLDELGRGDVPCREFLVDHLQTIPGERAVTGLALIALLDPAQPVYERAMEFLKERDDPNIASQFHLELRSPDDVIISRAAWAVGELGYRPAVPDLIPLLTVVREKWVEVVVKDFLGFQSPSGDLAPAGCYGLGGAPVSIAWNGQAGSSPIAVPWTGIYSPWFVHNEWRRRTVTQKRTEVLEALRKLTGENLGFDTDEWMAWYEQQFPLARQSTARHRSLHAAPTPRGRTGD